MKTIIFDLDETLIHCNDSSAKRSDVYLEVVLPDGSSIQVNFLFITHDNIGWYKHPSRSSKNIIRSDKTL